MVSPNDLDAFLGVEALAVQDKWCLEAARSKLDTCLTCDSKPRILIIEQIYYNRLGQAV